MFGFIMGCLAAIIVCYFIGLSVQLLRIEKSVAEIIDIVETRVRNKYSESNSN